MNGFFITFEGIEGSGKTTQTMRLADHLITSGLDVVLTREPGGTMLGKEIRKLLLDPAIDPMPPITELFLYFADRSEHVERLIKPSLEEGKVVVCDRFSDSTIAYQGYGRGLDLEEIITLDRIARGGLEPNLTILLDMDVSAGLERNRRADKFDRFEAEELDFHRRVRDGYLEIARKNPERIKVVDAGRGEQEVWEEIRAIVTDLISMRQEGNGFN